MAHNYCECGGNKGSCIDCAEEEIGRLKAELEEASTIANDNYQVILKCNGQINELKRQLAEAKTANLAIRSERDQAVAQLHAELAEASAENERLKRIVSSTERWEKLDGQLQQARQEAAKWVADLLFSPEWEKECHCCEDYYCSICRIKDEFKLEG